jgi:hypothetical protein
MTNPTSNYLWQMPTPVDLVTDLPADFEVFGQAVDNSLWNVGYGQAGKNKIINGDFRINQRSYVSSTINGYGFDRWTTARIGGTVTDSAQTFTAGAAPVAGYEAINFQRIITSGQSAAGDFAVVRQNIEDVRVLSQNITTISFWAKAATGTPKIAVELEQNFGSGGSAAVGVYVGQVTLTTSWVRYSVTTSSALPSLSGKTIGTGSALRLNLAVSAGSDFNARFGSLGIQNNTFDIWGVQVEYGSKATPFQTASGGSIQGELAMCQRYYYRNAPATTNGTMGNAIAASTTGGATLIELQTTMRVVPTSIDFSDIRFLLPGVNAYTITAATLNAGNSTRDAGYVDFTVGSGLVAEKSYFLQTGSTSGFIGFSAEL